MTLVQKLRFLSDQGTYGFDFPATGGKRLFKVTDIAQTAKAAMLEASAEIERLTAQRTELYWALTELCAMAICWETLDGRRNIQLEHSKAYQLARAAIASISTPHTQDENEMASEPGNIR